MLQDTHRYCRKRIKSCGTYYEREKQKYPGQRKLPSNEEYTFQICRV